MMVMHNKLQVTANLQSQGQLLILKFNISATMHTRKQSAVTFEVFVLWLHIQPYYYLVM